jgi:glucose/arabinose dehydrogenase
MNYRLKQAIVVLLGVACIFTGGALVSGAAEKNIDATVIADGLRNPWEVVFTPDNRILITEREGKLSVIENGQVRTVAIAPTGFFFDVTPMGQSGLTGLALDPNFTANRRIYMMMMVTKADKTTKNVVRRFRINETYTALSDPVDVVDGFSPAGVSESGFQAGGRLKFGPDGNLYIAMGDGNLATGPQSGTSLFGKILRVTPDGAAAQAAIAPGFDPRIYSFGHRNVQGFAFRPGDNSGNVYATEHGPDVDDEINLMRLGDNSGWDPVSPDPAVTDYNKDVPMTDTTKFPTARMPVAVEGAILNTTIAPAGATFINNPKWGEWNNTLAVTYLKGKRIILYTLSADGTTLVSKETPAALRLRNPNLDTVGLSRYRTIVQGPDGDLYVLTDDSVPADLVGKDRLIKLSLSADQTTITTAPTAAVTTTVPATPTTTAANTATTLPFCDELPTTTTTVRPSTTTVPVNAGTTSIPASTTSAPAVTTSSVAATSSTVVAATTSKPANNASTTTVAGATTTKPANNGSTTTAKPLQNSSTTTVANNASTTTVANNGSSTSTPATIQGSSTVASTTTAVPVTSVPVTSTTVFTSAGQTRVAVAGTTEVRGEQLATTGSNLIPLTLMGFGLVLCGRGITLLAKRKPQLAS